MQKYCLACEQMSHVYFSRYPQNGELAYRLSTVMLRYDPGLSYKDLHGVLGAK